MAPLVGLAANLTQRLTMRYIIHVPTPSGAMAPFPIDADSRQDLHRQARILFTHVWNRIAWPDGTAPQPRNPGRSA